MSVVSKLVPALLRKRLTSALIATSLCALLGACGNDDSAAATSTLGSTHSDAGGSGSNPSAHAALPADPSPPALTIQSPPLPSSDAGAPLSSAALAPLATPVIHTVD